MSLPRSSIISTQCRWPPIAAQLTASSPSLSMSVNDAPEDTGILVAPSMLALFLANCGNSLAYPMGLAGCYFFTVTTSGVLFSHPSSCWSLVSSVIMKLNIGGISQWWLGSLVVRALDLWLNSLKFDPWPPHYRSVGTAMSDHLWASIPPRYVTSHPGQLSLLTSVRRKMSTGQVCCDALQLGSKGRMAYSICG